MINHPASEACARCGESALAYLHNSHFNDGRKGWCDNDTCHAFVAADDAGRAQCEHTASADNPKICGKCRHVIVPMGPVDFIPIADSGVCRCGAWHLGTLAQAITYEGTKHTIEICHPAAKPEPAVGVLEAIARRFIGRESSVGYDHWFTGLREAFALGQATPRDSNPIPCGYCVDKPFDHDGPCESDVSLWCDHGRLICQECKMEGKTHKCSLASFCMACGELLEHRANGWFCTNEACPAKIPPPTEPAKGGEGANEHAEFVRELGDRMVTSKPAMFSIPFKETGERLRAAAAEIERLEREAEGWAKRFVETEMKLVNEISERDRLAAELAVIKEIIDGATPPDECNCRPDDDGIVHELCTYHQLRTALSASPEGVADAIKAVPHIRYDELDNVWDVIEGDGPHDRCPQCAIQRAMGGGKA